MWPSGTHRGPEAVDTAGVDEVTFLGRDQQGKERATPAIDAVPADVECLFPLVPRIIEEALPANDSGVVEQQIDVIGAVLGDYGIPEGEDVPFQRNVAGVRCHPRSGWRG